MSELENDKDGAEVSEYDESYVNVLDIDSK